MTDQIAGNAGVTAVSNYSATQDAIDAANESVLKPITGTTAALAALTLANGIPAYDTTLSKAQVMQAGSLQNIVGGGSNTITTIHADDYASLQDAHDALPAAGGKILLGPSTYTALDVTTLLDKTAVTIVGEGPDLSTISGGGSAHALSVVGATGDLVSNVTFKGIKFSATGNYRAVNCEYISKIKFIDCEFEANGTVEAVKLLGYSGDEAVDCEFIRCKFTRTYGIGDDIRTLDCDYTDSLIVSECNLNSDNGRGFYVQNSDGVTISKNYIYGERLALYPIECTNLVIEGNRYIGSISNTALAISGGSYISVSGNAKITNNTTYGCCFIYDSTNGISQVTFSHNNFYASGDGPAFYCNAAGGGTISDVTLTGNFLKSGETTTYAVYLRGDVVTFVGNTIRYKTGVTAINNGATNYVVANNNSVVF